MERGGKEVQSSEIGEQIMHELHDLDQVAYVRFASVYRSFKDLNDFMEEVKTFLERRERTQKKVECLNSYIPGTCTAALHAKVGMSLKTVHEDYMRAALALAHKGAGRVSPNPMVGALVVRKGRVVGAGYHRAFGAAHAEVNALRRAGSAARGADLYVTLEPCSHHGKTPPCVDQVIASGIKRVFIGQVDPNPLVRGRGIRRLRAAGLEVMVGILRAECAALNEAFSKHVTTGLPLVTLKAAMTLDGKIATRTGDSRWITCAQSRRMVHRMRAEADAVMVGIGTVLTDDPQLNVRLGRQKARSAAHCC